MDDILKRIIDIEDKAQNIVGEAKKELLNFDDNINGTIEKMKKDIDKRTDKTIERINNVESENLQKNIEEARNSFEEKMGRINKTYEENKEKWVLYVYNKLIGGR